MPRHEDLMKGMIAFILYNGQVFSTHPLDVTNSPMNLLDDLLANQYLPPEDVEAIRGYLSGVSTPPPELQLVGRYHMITDKITGYGPDNGSANQEFVRSQLRGTFRQTKTAMPYPAEKWKEHAPATMLYHGTTASRALEILRWGLIPQAGSDFSHWTPETGLRSRPGHVYLTDSLDSAVHHTTLPEYSDHPDDDNRGAVLVIDATMLDPALLNPDEDSVMEHTEPYIGDSPTPLDLLERKQTEGLGEWAEEVGYGDDPRHTEWAFSDTGNIAYRGAIPPEAIRLLTRDEWEGTGWRGGGSADNSGLLLDGASVNAPQPISAASSWKLAGDLPGGFSVGDRVRTVDPHTRIWEGTVVDRYMNSTSMLLVRPDDHELTRDQRSDQHLAIPIPIQNLELLDNQQEQLFSKKADVEWEGEPQEMFLPGTRVRVNHLLPYLRHYKDIEGEVVRQETDGDTWSFLVRFDDGTEQVFVGEQLLPVGQNSSECPTCGSTLDIYDETSGRWLVCPNCGYTQKLYSNPEAEPDLLNHEPDLDAVNQLWPDVLPWGEEGNEYFRNAPKWAATSFQKGDRVSPNLKSYYGITPAEGTVVEVRGDVVLVDWDAKPGSRRMRSPIGQYYANDLILIKNVEQQLFARRVGMPTNPALMNRLKFKERPYRREGQHESRYLYAYDMGKAIGWVLYVTDDTFPEYAKIRDLEVIEEYQRQGVATRLVDELFARYPSAEHDDDFSPEGAAWLEVYDPDAYESAGKPLVQNMFSKKGFLVIAADVAQLAADMRVRLYQREDIATMRQQYLDTPVEFGMEGPVTSPSAPVYPFPGDPRKPYNPKYNPAMVRAIEYALTNLPDELYKFFPWVVKQVKTGQWFNFDGVSQAPNRIDQLHGRDILWQAFNHMEYLRSQPKNSPNAAPVPDINQMNMEQLEAWVYERNALGLDVSGSVWEEKEPIYKLANGWAIWPVRTENDLKREGDAMGHCVGGYCNQVKAGSTTIWSLRDPQLGSHVTIELEPHEQIVDDPVNPANQSSGYNVIQVQGKSNQEPKEEYKEMVREWFQTLLSQGVSIEVNINISDAYDLQYMSGGLGEYGIPMSVSITDINYLAESVVDEVISSSANSMLDNLDQLIEEDHLDAEQMNDALNQEAYKKIEAKVYDLRSDWEESRDRLRRDYEDYVQSFENEQDELEAQAEEDDDEDAYDFEREEPEDFETWLYENGHEEYSEHSEPDFEDLAKEEIGWGIDEVIDRYRYHRRSSWKIARRLLDYVDKVGIKDFCPNCKSEHPKTMYLPKDLVLQQSINNIPICRDCVTTLLDYAEAVRTTAVWKPQLGEEVMTIGPGLLGRVEEFQPAIFLGDDGFWAQLRWHMSRDGRSRSRWPLSDLRPMRDYQNTLFSKSADVGTIYDEPFQVDDRVRLRTEMDHLSPEIKQDFQDEPATVVKVGERYGDWGYKVWIKWDNPRLPQYQMTYDFNLELIESSERKLFSATPRGDFYEPGDRVRSTQTGEYGTVVDMKPMGSDGKKAQGHIPVLWDNPRERTKDRGWQWVFYMDLELAEDGVTSLFSKRGDRYHLTTVEGDRVRFRGANELGTVVRGGQFTCYVKWDNPTFRAFKMDFDQATFEETAQLELVEDSPRTLFSARDDLFAKTAAVEVRPIDPFTTPVLVEMGLGENEEPYEVVFPDTEMETIAYNAYIWPENSMQEELIGSIVFMPLTDETQINAIKQFGYDGPVTWVEWIYVRPEYRNLEAFGKLTEPVRQYAAENNMPIAAHFQNEQLQRVVDRFLKRPVTASQELRIGDRVSIPSPMDQGEEEQGTVTFVVYEPGLYGRLMATVKWDNPELQRFLRGSRFPADRLTLLEASPEQLFSRTAGKYDEFEIGDRIIPALAGLSEYPPERMPSGTITDKRERGHFEEPGYRFEYLVQWDEPWMGESDRKALTPWHQGFTLAHLPGQNLQLFGALDMATEIGDEVITIDGAIGVITEAWASADNKRHFLKVKWEDPRRRPNPEEWMEPEYLYPHSDKQMTLGAVEVPLQIGDRVRVRETKGYNTLYPVDETGTVVDAEEQWAGGWVRVELDNPKYRNVRSEWMPPSTFDLIETQPTQLFSATLGEFNEGDRVVSLYGEYGTVIGIGTRRAEILVEWEDPRKTIKKQWVKHEFLTLVDDKQMGLFASSSSNEWRLSDA